MKFILLINVKMPTVVGILTLISWINTFVGILTFISWINTIIGILTFISWINTTFDSNKARKIINFQHLSFNWKLKVNAELG